MLAALLPLAACVTPPSSSDSAGASTASGDTADAGPATRCDLSVSPATVDLGEVALGEVGDFPLSFTNAGTVGCELAISQGEPGGALATTLYGPGYVEGGASFQWTYTWSPYAAGTLETALLVTSNDPDTPEFVVPVVGSCPG